MQFPNAYKGIRKVFLAEILVIAASVLAIVSATLALAIPNPGDGAKVALAAIAGVSGIIAIVALVFQLIGLGQGGKDNGYLKIAFFIIILSLVLTVTTTILASFFPQYASAYSVLDTISNMASAVVLVLVIFGISVLASQLNDEKMMNKGRLLINLIIILFILLIAINIATTFIKNPADWWTTFVAVFGIIAAILELVIYVLYLIYLAKAVKMLKK